MRFEPHDDPWLLGATPAATATTPDKQPSNLTITIIDNIVPLSAGLDQTSIPEVLNDPLFGGTQQTFAILDAAKIPNLIEFLGASDLAHRCIYHSNDDPALEAVAPWLVQLDPHADFTKKLFTSSDLPWDFWEKKPGFYLRSNQDIDQLTQHFRRYVQVPDPTGKHMFFRFWEPDVLALYLQFHAIDARQRVEGFVGQNTFLVPDLHHRHVVSAMVSDPSCGVRHGRWPNLIEDLSHIRFELFLRGLNAKICAKMPALLQLADDKREAGVRKMALAAFDLGLKSETSITRYVQATLILGHGPEQDAQFADLIHSKQHELDRSRKILARAKHTSETP